jgi:AraC-like DNA-binding protein
VTSVSVDVPIRTQAVAPILSRIRAVGGDVAAVCRELGLEPSAESQPETIIGVDALERLYERAATVTKDPDFGLHLARDFPRGTYGIVEFLARSSAIVGEGWRRIVELAALMNDRVTVRLDEGPRTARLRHAVVGRPRGYGRHGNEFFVPAVLSQTRLLVSTPIVVVRAWFAHARPPDTSEHARLLGTDDIEWGVGENGLEVPASVLSLAVGSADAPLSSVLAREAKKALSVAPPPARSLADRVRASVAALLDRGAPSLEDAAATLHMSPRTLQRRLAEEDTTFVKVVDGVREERARAWVGEGRLGLAEIGFRLGYADLPAFLRAFKRWTGTTPARFAAK